MTMMDYALDYASRGFHVLPIAWPVRVGCCCGSGANCKDIGKHPITEHGVNDATVDPVLIELWWRKWPSANIGIATGAVSGVIVLDVDPKHGGDASMTTILNKHGRPTPTPVVITGSGPKGRHIYWRHPGGPIKNIVGLADGLDLKSDGGYVIAPPSLHASGRRYQWHAEGRLDEHEIQDAPGWLWDRVVAAKSHRGRKSKALMACRGHIVSPESIPKLSVGERNDELMRIACRLVWEKKSQSDTAQLVRQINRACCTPPLPDREVERMIHGIFRRYAC